MPPQGRLKIIVVGPKQSGKTQIANFLGHYKENLFEENHVYDPTVGVRILQTDIQHGQSSHQVASIELWDCSGDNKYEGCWKAIMQDADGVLLVYNPDSPSHDVQLNDWFEFFVKNNGMSDEQCLIFSHRITPSDTKFRPPPLFSRVSAALTGPGSDANIKAKFTNFVKDLVLADRK